MFSWVVPGAMAERHGDVTDCRIADVVPAVTTVHGVRVPWSTYANLWLSLQGWTTYRPGASQAYHLYLIGSRITKFVRLAWFLRNPGIDFKWKSIWSDANDSAIIVNSCLDLVPVHVRTRTVPRRLNLFHSRFYCTLQIHVLAINFTSFHCDA